MMSLKSAKSIKKIKCQLPYILLATQGIQGLMTLYTASDCLCPKTKKKKIKLFTYMSSHSLCLCKQCNFGLIFLATIF